MQIDHHRHDIENRISQLETKLKARATHVESIRPFVKEIHKDRQPLTTLDPQFEMQVRPSKEGFKRKESLQNYSNTLDVHPRVCRDAESVPKKTAEAPKQNNRELLEMMRAILDGQRHIEKELQTIKNDYMRESNRFSKDGSVTQSHIIDNRASFGKQSLKRSFQGEPPKKKYDEKPPLKVEQQPPLVENPPLAVHPVQKAAESAQKQKRTAQQSRGRVGSVRKNKLDHIEELISVMMGQRGRKERVIVTEEGKAKVWRQVETQVRESDREYQDPIHRNTKHEHDHLINTYELQRKLKDELVSKVFQQCSNPKYK